MEQTVALDHLYEGCKANDPRAQEMLYRKLASGMLGVCMRYVRTTAEAEDVLQAGFIKVFTQIESFRGEGSFEGWIRRVMINTAIETYRKNGRSVQVMELSEVTDAPQEAAVIDALACEDLLAMIRLLPDGYRAVFNLYAIEGYSHKEIAELLEISEGASKSQLSRARNWLKERIKQIKAYESR
ncbi:RNA polymerase sigma factor [Parapedobacter lycopersici]|uniref:RNA polymerase sigma factor n=1 Tax=Parapedobacter lycopersici TaxID=1864939 RepID=UPI00214DE4CD|nr:sigma-70 family RNA polymerase sigma factor [Parapedobacter lycopersici]